jgi:hypothetical protein
MFVKGVIVELGAVSTVIAMAMKNGLLFVIKLLQYRRSTVSYLSHWTTSLIPCKSSYLKICSLTTSIIDLQNLTDNTTYAT